MAALYVSASILVALIAHGISAQPDKGKPLFCQFEPLNGKLVAEEVCNFLAGKGAKLIRYNVAFHNYSDNTVFEAGGDLFRPQWIRTVNRQGMNLLMFDDNFEVLSLQLLSIGILDMNLELVDNPRGCIQSLDVTERMHRMRALLLTDFQNTTTNGAADRDLYEQICNKRVYIPKDQAEKGNRAARFTYTCCHGNSVICNDIQEDTWILILNYILGVAIIVFILYCPKFFSLIIDNRETEDTIDFKGTLPEKCSVSVRREDNDYFIDNGHTKLSLDGLPKANRFISTLSEPNSAVECRISDITISVPHARLLPNGCYPVSIFRVFYDGIFHCGMGRSASLKPCCMSAVCCKWCTVCKCKWLSLLSIFSRILLLLLFCTPFIIQYVVYYNYIRPNFDEESEACRRLNATCLVHKKGLDLLGVSDLSKISLAVYVCIAVVSGLVVEYVLGRCFAKTAIFSTLLIKSQKVYKMFPIFKVLLSKFISPFKDYGVLGFLLYPIYIPWLLFFVLYSILMIFPLMKIIFGLFQFTLSVGYWQSKGKKPIWRILIECCLYLVIYYIFLASMMVLITFCITFYTEIFFYTFVGVIANAGMTLPFVTMLLPLGVYTRQILGKVGEMYMNYLTLLNQIILSRYVADNGDLGEQIIEDHEGTVLFVRSFSAEKSVDIVSNLGDGDEVGKCISYHGNMLLIFLETATDVNDSLSVKSENEAKPENAREKWIRKIIPSKDKFEKNIKKPYNSTGKYYIYTPTELFLHVVDQDLPGSPGLISSSIIQAFVRLFYVVGFLGFVVVAVMGLGASYKITLTDQLMLTVVGGVIPLIFRYGLFNYRLSSIDWDNEELKLNVIKAIEKFSERWEVVDMTLCTLDSETVGSDDVHVDVGEEENADDLNTGTNEHVIPESPEGAVCIPMTEVGPSTSLTT